MGFFDVFDFIAKSRHTVDTSGNLHLRYLTGLYNKPSECELDTCEIARTKVERRESNVRNRH